MPYASIKQIPDYVKKYSAKLQRQWFYVFNSTWKTLSKQGVSTKDKERRAASAANSVLKKRFKGKESMIKNTDIDYFVHLVDRWIGNLK